MPSNANPKARANEIILQELEKELLIYDLESNKAYCLNETSALVWQTCDGNRSISEISQLITKKLKSTVDEDFVWLAIEQLKKENLLENSTQIVGYFEGLSRREAIRKAGLASMIALPVISSLVAPTAAMAQSAGACQTSNQTCSFNNYTQSNCCSALFCNSSSKCQACIESGAIYRILDPTCNLFGGSCQAVCDSDSNKNACCNSGSAQVITDNTGTFPYACACP